VQDWAGALARRFGHLPELEIENKRWSLTVDYRHVPDLAQTERALAAFARTLPGVRVLGGRHADLNLAPAGEHHKGTALERHLEALGRRSALYVGDDRTDEDVFGHPVPGLVSVRVGPKAGSRAQYFLQEQPDVDRLLDALWALVDDPVR
jgi:trehalose 6-phosphate phosphatase